MSQSRPHRPVMMDEFLKFFEGSDLKVFFEGTVGAGGHAAALLEAHPEMERYLACDRDPEALELAKQKLMPWKQKVLDTILHKRGIQEVNGFFLT
jgi:16S rRNA (cytosine1402-N4)-methyltransferase